MTNLFDIKGKRLLLQEEPVCAQPLLPATEAETEEIRRILKEGNLV